MLDEHDYGAGGRVEMLLEELMRQHEAHVLTRMHSPTIGVVSQSGWAFPIVGNRMRIIVTSGTPEDRAPSHHPPRVEGT